LAALALVGAGSPAAALVIDTFPDWDGNVTFGWLGTAQTFTVPEENVLLNYSFAVAPRDPGQTLQFSIVAWDATAGPMGPTLYAVDVPWPEDGGPVTVAGINLPLVSGGLYGAWLEFGGYDGMSVHFTNQDVYPGGNGWWLNEFSFQSNPELDHRFRVEFGSAVPEPSAIALALGAMLAVVPFGCQRLGIGKSRSGGSVRQDAHI
jgi:hypothetical protein